LRHQQHSRGSRLGRQRRRGEHAKGGGGHGRDFRWADRGSVDMQQYRNPFMVRGEKPMQTARRAPDERGSGRALLRLSTLVAVLAMAWPASAADDARFPERPVRWIVTFPVGGSIDIVDRV